MSVEGKNIDWSVVSWSLEKIAGSLDLSREICVDIMGALEQKGMLSDLFEVQRDSGLVLVKEGAHSEILRGHFWIGPMVVSKALAFSNIDIEGSTIKTQVRDPLYSGNVCAINHAVDEEGKYKPTLSKIVTDGEEIKRVTVLEWSFVPRDKLKVNDELLNITEPFWPIISDEQLDKYMPHRSPFRFVTSAVFVSQKDTDKIQGWDIFAWTYEVPKASPFLEYQRDEFTREETKCVNPFLYEEIAAQIGTAAMGEVFWKDGKILIFWTTLSRWSGLKIQPGEKVSVVGEIKSMKSTVWKIQYILRSEKWEIVMEWEITGFITDQERLTEKK